MLSDDFVIRDSGARQEFSGGMVRDTTEGKPNYLNVTLGPMLDRWAVHTTKGRQKYPDVSPGVPNWTLAEGLEEQLRAQESALRHLLQWLRGDRDEDHAAAVFFNVNLAEYVRARMQESGDEEKTRSFFCDNGHCRTTQCATCARQERSSECCMPNGGNCTDCGMRS